MGVALLAPILNDTLPDVSIDGVMTLGVDTLVVAVNACATEADPFMATF